jgi:hypothetical protein
MTLSKKLYYWESFEAESQIITAKQRGMSWKQSLKMAGISTCWDFEDITEKGRIRTELQIALYVSFKRCLKCLASECW